MAKPVPTGDWILRKPRAAKARLRLFCFPYAAGGPSAFRGWAEALPSLEICSIQAPGREMRLREPPIDRVEGVVDALSSAILPHLDQPFAFFGYSLGGFVAFELAKRLRRDGAPLPAHLFIGATPSPQLHQVKESFLGLPDDRLLERLRDYQGTPPEVFQHAELVKLILPIVRADFAAFEVYTHAPAAPLDVPITALGGLQDPDVSREQLEGWRAHTSRAFVLRMFPGNHFFINSDRARLLGVVLQDLAPHLGR